MRNRKSVPLGVQTQANVGLTLMERGKRETPGLLVTGGARCHLEHKPTSRLEILSSFHFRDQKGTSSSVLGERGPMAEGSNKFSS